MARKASARRRFEFLSRPGLRWSDAERKLGAAYARAAEQTLVRWLADLGRSTVALDDGKRASVEIAALLDLAAKIAQDRLRLSADEFATAACDIFIKDQL